MSDDDAELRSECRRLTEALELAERDRQLLGYEIHDDVVQDLTAAAMQLEGAGRQASFVSPDGKESYAGGLRLLQEGIAKARGLIRGSAGVELDPRGLQSALTRLVQRFRSEQGLQLTFACDIPEVPLPTSMQHLLLRIAQESLFNVWKHAQATEIQTTPAIGARSGGRSVRAQRRARRVVAREAVRTRRSARRWPERR